MIFEVSKEELERARAWIKEKKEYDLAKQVANCVDCNKGTRCITHAMGPYYGAIGGEVTWEFTPTSIGTIVKVRLNDESFDVTDFNSW